MKSICLFIVAFVFFVGHGITGSAEPAGAPAETIKLLDKKIVPITEPPCSYCSTQHLKIVRGDDRVIAWLRADHNGGSFPIRLFLAGPRVVNDMRFSRTCRAL